MDLERMRDHLLQLPHVVETEQFGGLVYWLGDKAIGGRMFAMMNPEANEHPISWPAGAEHFAELVEQDGLAPAPYMARIFWIAAERWDVFRNVEWLAEIDAAHARTLAKLTPKTRAILTMPAAEQRRLVSAGRKQLAAKASAVKEKKAAARTQR